MLKKSSSVLVLLWKSYSIFHLDLWNVQTLTEQWQQMSSLTRNNYDFSEGSPSLIKQTPLKPLSNCTKKLINISFLSFMWRDTVGVHSHKKWLGSSQGCSSASALISCDENTTTGGTELKERVKSKICQKWPTMTMTMSVASCHFMKPCQRLEVVRCLTP